MANEKEKSRAERLRGMIEEAEGGKVEPVRPAAITPTAALASPQRESEDIDSIISRLRQNGTPTASIPRSLEIPTAAPSQPGAKMEFRHVSSELARGVTFLGKIFTLLEGPLTKLASLLGNLPIAKGLANDLLSANMQYSLEAYLALVATAGLVFFFLVTITMGSIGAILMDNTITATAPLLGIAGFLLFSFFALRWPSIRGSERATAVDRELPFALRQLATQVRAGVSFNRSIASIAEGNYPLLSPEFRRVLADLDRGQSTEEALLGLAARSKSRGIRRAVSQILRALRTGGKVSDVISNIAEDVSFETRMRIRDFTETLNLVSVVYIMVGVVAPVGLTILSAVVQLPLLSGFVPPEYILYAFLGILGAMCMLILVTLRLEPGG